MSVINFNKYKENKDEIENSYLEFLPIWNKYWDAGPYVSGDVLFKQLYIALRLADSGIMLIKTFNIMGIKGRKLLIGWLEDMIENLRN